MSARVAQLIRTGCHWGILWEGTPEQLVAAGVLTAAQVEDLRQWERETIAHHGCLKGRRRPPLTLSSGRRATVSKALGRRNAWAVREQFNEREHAEELTRRARVAEARRMLDKYGSPERARRTLEAVLLEGLVGVMCAFNLTNAPSLPYRFDADTCAAVAALARELMAAFARGRLTVVPQPNGVDFERFMRSILPQ